MNQLLDNLLLISENMQSMDSFLNIKARVESLDEEDPNYKELVKQTDLVVKVLTAFSKSYWKEKKYLGKFEEEIM